MISEFKNDLEKRLQNKKRCSLPYLKDMRAIKNQGYGKMKVGKKMKRERFQRKTQLVLVHGKKNALTKKIKVKNQKVKHTNKKRQQKKMVVGN